MVTVRLPRSHWSQIVSDIENMCGTDSSEIEILSQAQVVEDGGATQCTCVPMSDPITRQPLHAWDCPAHDGSTDG